MAHTIDGAYTNSYKAGFELALQKLDSVLANAVEDIPDAEPSENASLMPLMKELDYTAPRSDPLADVPLDRAMSERRWISPVKFEKGVAVVNNDTLEQLTDPTNSITQNMKALIERWMDERVIGPAFFAPAMVGKEFSDSAPKAFDNARHAVPIGTGGSDALNTAKLATAAKILIEEHVLRGDGKGEQVFLGLSPEHNAQLLTLYYSQTKDSRVDVKINGLVVTEFAGIKTIFMDWIQPTAGVYELPLWVKSGMARRWWRKTYDFVAHLPQKGDTHMVYSERRCGAARTQEGKVLKIRCDGSVDWAKLD